MTLACRFCKGYLFVLIWLRIQCLPTGMSVDDPGYLACQHNDIFYVPSHLLKRDHQNPRRRPEIDTGHDPLT